MTAHLKAQALRFLRVSALAFLTALPVDGGSISWSSLWALAAGAAETGLRQLLPVKPLPTVTSAPAPEDPAHPGTG